MRLEERLEIPCDLQTQPPRPGLEEVLAQSTPCAESVHIQTLPIHPPKVAIAEPITESRGLPVRFLAARDDFQARRWNGVIVGRRFTLVPPKPRSNKRSASSVIQNGFE